MAGMVSWKMIVYEEEEGTRSDPSAAIDTRITQIATVGGTDVEGRKKKNHLIHYYIGSRYNNTGVTSSCNIAIWQRMSEQ